MKSEKQQIRELKKEVKLLNDNNIMLARAILKLNAKIDRLKKKNATLKEQLEGLIL